MPQETSKETATNPSYPDWLSATLASDALAALSIEGRVVLAGTTQTIKPNCRTIGPAYVVLASQDDNQVVTRLLANPPQPGSVLVIAGHSASHTATVGGLLAQEMQLVGFVALVTDGLVRDVQELRQLKMPIWCRGATTRASAKRNPGLIGEPIVIGGALVQQGDLVIADDDGVVFWPLADIEKLLTQAQVKLDSDNARLAKLQARAAAQQ